MWIPAMAHPFQPVMGGDSVGAKKAVSMPSCPYDLNEYFQKNLHYPGKARRKKIDGRVLVGFVVADDGVITDVKIVTGVHKLLDKEAVRIVTAMPPWTPGTKNGMPVRVFYKLPVMFKLK
jgi:protein TonB